MRNKKLLAIIIIVVLIFMPIKVFALLIVPGNTAGFTDDQLLAIYDAIAEWQAFFIDSNDHVVTIDFASDNNLRQNQGALAITNDDIDQQTGYPFHAAITIDSNDVNWSEPYNSQGFALQVLKHEVGHAIGIYGAKNSLWGSDIPKLYSVWLPYTLPGGGTDMNHSGYSGDVMAPDAKTYLVEPVQYDANALTIMYSDYHQTPEPATLISLLLGAFGFAIRRFWR